MKKINLKKLGLLAIGLWLGLAAWPQQSKAQDVVYSSATVNLSATTVPANATTTVTSDAMRVRGNQGIAILPTFNLAGSGTNQVTFKFDVSHDGSTWTTVSPFTYAVSANGTNTVRGFANFGPATSASLNNIRYLRLSSIQVDNASTNSVTNIALRYSSYAK
jgi:hypothetical protein